MTDVNMIKVRNEKIIRLFLEKYEIEPSYEELITDYTGLVSILENFETRRFKLYGNKIIYMSLEVEEGMYGTRTGKMPSPKNDKTTSPLLKRVQLLAYNRQEIDSFGFDQLKAIMKDIIEFETVFKQLKLLETINKQEVSMLKLDEDSERNATLLTEDQIFFRQSKIDKRVGKVRSKKDKE